MTYAFYFIVTLFGVFAHFAKKKIKGQTLDSVKTYFKSNFKSTMIMFGSAVILFASAIAAGGLNIITAATIGYTADSLYNENQPPFFECAVIYRNSHSRSYYANL